MRKRSAYAVNSMVLVALTLLSCVVSLSADAKPKFTSFDFPGALTRRPLASRHRETSWAGTPARMESNTDSSYA